MEGLFMWSQVFGIYNFRFFVWMLQRLVNVNLKFSKKKIPQGKNRLKETTCLCNNEKKSNYIFVFKDELIAYTNFGLKNIYNISMPL